jgi:hypothetical protein
MNSFSRNATRPVLVLLLLLVSLVGFSQAKYTVSGYVKDDAAGESMIGANVYIKELMDGTTTNQYGFYSITLEEGQYTLVISYIGYVEQEIPLDLTQDIRHNVSVKMNGIMGTEFVVEETRADGNTDGVEMGMIEMEVSQIKQLPALLGEVDILKAIQFLPGVSSGGEGSSGFYVRGGGPDQNLILLDNAVVYNASHLFGFFSVFNADAVKNIELIKGGMPAQYGGRLASVLDITMKDGNSRKFEVDGGIGLISSRLTVQGPIKKDTSSFIISGRRTYIDVIAKPFIPDSSAFSGSGYYFYDLNAKINYTLSDKDRLFLSGYFGRDVFTFTNQESNFSINIPWGNATATARWNHLFSDKLFMNTTAVFNSYQFAFEATQSDFDFRLFSGIKDWNLKVDFNYYPSLRHNIRFGTNYIYHTFTPNNATASSGDIVFDTGDITKILAHEAAGYVSDEFDLSDKIKIVGGLRWSYFRQVGPFDRYAKDERGITTDTIHYDKGDNVADYSGWEPRLGMRYKLNKVSSLKAAYTRNYQYIHLATLSGLSLPTDVWVPSSDRIKPQFGVQYNIGYFRNFKDNMFETSVEIYYKEMENLIEYQEGAAPENDVNDNPDNQLIHGNGTSYGLELFLKKRTGKLTGWIGYTWSKTMRIFEGINEGLEFPAKYDRRHDVSVILTQKLGEKWTLGAAFVYATGNAVTLPVSRYIIEGRVIDEFGARNSYRMVPYHRADVSATYTPNKIKTLVDPVTGEETEVKKRFQSTWAFSVYNLYNRANPYFIYFDYQGDIAQGTFEAKAFQVSLFPILPAITWNFSF